MKQNILPKSLHTITVLVNVARQSPYPADAATAVVWALGVLGYDATTPDTYQLAAKARAILSKSVQS